MKVIQESNLKLNLFVLVMGGAIRLKNRNGAQCAVLPGRSKSGATKNVTWQKGA